MKGRLAAALAVVVVVQASSAPNAWSKIMFERFERPRVVVVERPWPPLVEVWVQLPVGALADPKGQDGLSHLTWQTAIEAGGKRNSRKFARALDKIGGTLDADVGARNTIVHGRVPTRHIGKFMALLASAILRPRLDRADFKRQRRIAIADAVSVRDDDEELADDAARRYLHRGQPAGRSYEGSVASLRKLKRKHARKLHAGVVRSGLHFGFAGNLRRQQALELVRDHFGDIEPRRKALVNRRSKPPKLAGRRLLLLNRQGRSQAQVVVMVPTIGAASPAMPALLVAATALGGTFTSRLVRQVRELRGWSYSIEAGLLVGYKSGVLAVRWAPDNRVVGASIDLVMGQLELLRASGLTKKEVGFVHDHLKGAHRLAIETAAGELAERMRALALGLPVDYPQRLSAMIKRVDKKYLGKALNKHFDPSRAIAVVVGDGAVLSTSLARLMSGFAVESIPYTGAPEETKIPGKPVQKTLLAKPPPPPDPNAPPGPNAIVEHGPIFDESGKPIDEASLPTGDTETDATDDDDEPDGEPPPTSS